jgi:hypothetical protein
MPLRISKEGIKAGLLTINPWLFLLSKLPSITLKINNLEWIINTIIIICGSISLIYTKNLLIIPQIIGLIIFSSIVSKYKKNESLNVVWILRLYMIFGTLVSLFNYLGGEGRIGLFGSEINFTGYTTIILFIVINKLDRLRLYDFLIIITLIILTGSRAFIIMTLVTYALYMLRKRTNFITVLVMCAYISFFSAQFILAYSDEIPFLQKTGYINDLSRLYQFNDSSTHERLRIIQMYVEAFYSEPVGLLFGYNPDLNTNINMESHNSIIQKIFEYGLIHTVILLGLLYRKLPRHIFGVITIYGLFLHNLFSLPLLIFMKIYMNEKEN